MANSLWNYLTNFNYQLKYYCSINIFTFQWLNCLRDHYLFIEDNLNRDLHDSDLINKTDQVHMHEPNCSHRYISSVSHFHLCLAFNCIIMTKMKMI